ncbi:hypothetical protein PAEPH01_1725 [Pancytospora epiphaga]|nr:hypothetical protein PAEPH01_1725 [Pancytospora epiphaga]
MEKEIDSIFIEEKRGAFADDRKIERLRECVNALPRLDPYLDLLHSNAEDIRKHLAVYDIQLRSLAAELDSIQKKNGIIEERNKNEKTVYEELKNLCVALTVDDEHFKILEEGSFIDFEELGKMEKSINIIGVTDLSKYTIRVVREGRERIQKAQRNFLKRFVGFINKLLVEPEHFGELRVHKSLYQLIYRYKFIYRFGRQFEEFYTVMRNAYENHAMSLYEKEFEKYLRGISDLIDDAGKLSLAIGVLLRSYECLVDSEVNFKRRMDADFSISQIFSNANSVIIEFIGEMFGRSKIVTLTSVGIVLNSSNSDIPEFEKFMDDLKKRYEVLEGLFLKKEKESKVTWGKIADMNAMLGAACLDTLKNGLLSSYVERLVIDGKEGGIKEYLMNMQALYFIRSDSSLIKNGIERMREGLPQRIIKHVFTTGDECVNVSRALEGLDPERPGYGEITRQLREVILANAEGEARINLEKLLTHNREQMEH